MGETYERCAHEAGGEDQLSGEVGVAPEGRGVDCCCFSEGAHEHASGQLIASGWERPPVDDVSGEEWGQGYNNVFGEDNVIFCADEIGTG